MNFQNETKKVFMKYLSASRIAICLCVMSLANTVWAGVYMTTLPNGASNQIIDRHCLFGRYSNASGKDIMVPHKTASELTSFKTHLPTGVTLGPPFYSSSGPFSFNVLDVVTAASSATATEVQVKAPDYSYTDTLTITFSLNFFTTQGCSGNVYQNTVPTALSNSLSISVCQNDYIYFTFSCPVNAIKQTTMTIKDSGGTTIDTAFICINNGYGGGSCI